MPRTLIWFSSLILLLSIYSPDARAQHTSGWCSPIILHATGSVTVNCIGVDPAAMRILTLQLAQLKLDRIVLMQRANSWAARYHWLRKQLSSQPSDDELSKLALHYLTSGDFKNAEKMLRTIQKQNEPQEKRSAKTDFELAQVIELEFKTAEALDLYRRAYYLDSDRLIYGLAYAKEPLRRRTI